MTRMLLIMIAICFCGCVVEDRHCPETPIKAEVKLSHTIGGTNNGGGIKNN